MESKIKKVLKQPRVWLLLVFLVLSLLAIPSYQPDGVIVSFVTASSPFQGSIVEGDIITHINDEAVPTLTTFATIIGSLEPNAPIRVNTNKGTYSGTTIPTRQDPTVATLGLHVSSTSKISFPLGLDLQGGSSVVLDPIPVEGTVLNDQLIETTIQVLNARLNAFGLSNVILRKIEDVNGHTFISVEMAGEGSEKVVDLVKSVGKFELKILNETILTGDAILPPIGEPQSSGGSLQTGSSGGWTLPFTINQEASQALMTSYVEVIPAAPTSCTQDEDCTELYSCSFSSAGGQCIPAIMMYLDDEETFAAPPAQSLVSSWLVGEDANNLIVQTRTFEDANRVKIVLEAGRLPNQIDSLEVVSQQYVDPRLGKDFMKGTILAVIAALVAVGIVLSIRYRKFNIVAPILFVNFSEIIIILGMASLINWSIDLPAIAGIIVVLGTAVDQQIVITDEIRAGKLEHYGSVHKMMKQAFRIVIVAASTTIAAMVPLAYPGFTGLYALRGFAIVTILGVLLGLFVTRPAYAKMAQIFISD